MGDSLSWGSTLNDFCKWVESASHSELKSWLQSVRGKEFSYRDEIPVVKMALRRATRDLTTEQLNDLEVQKHLKKAMKMRDKLHEYRDKYSDAISEAINVCIHPEGKVFEWYEVDMWGDMRSNYFQCVQCGLRERGSYSVVFKNAINSGKNCPDIVKRTFTRMFSDAERDEYRQSK